MRTSTLKRNVVLLSVVFLLPYAGGCAGCGGPGNNPKDAGVADGNGNGTDGGGNPDGGGTDGGKPDGGKTDGGGTGRPPANPNNPNNATIDSDCDGLSDAEEFANTYGGGLKTDPNNPDTDGDGIPDGVELGRTSSPDPSCTNFVGDADPSTTTDPTVADTDMDGIPDGIEDANHDGAYTPDETDPNNPDTDGDGLNDGCEDKNHNGIVDPGETDPRKRDTDGDGLPDGLEDKNHNCRVDPGETDPTNPDTDGDGIPDGTEDANHNGRVDPGETDPLVPDVDTDHDGITDAREINVTHTDPNNPDTDGDGLLDGIEDKNQDGKVNLGETDPLRVDTDCDGLTDGQEDANHNGKVDQGETDPTNPDTDGDGLPDGLEEGVTTNPDPTNCPNVALDQDPTTTTDPLNPDTDGDGLMDGVEDRNHNGRVDPADPANNIPAETDPNNPNDANPVTTDACATANLVKVLYQNEAQGDVQAATLTTYGDVTVLKSGADAVGVMVYDSTNKVLGIAVSTTPAGAAVTADVTAVRNAFNNNGGAATVITQPFTTWDGYSANRGTLDWTNTTDIKTAANTWVNAIRGGLTGQWTGTAGVTGAFNVAIEEVRRSANRSVYVAAFTPTASVTESRTIAVDDLANGSPLAQVGDTTGVQCDTFLTKPPQPVDFIYVVDNSCSMAEEQTALQNATTTTVSQLQNSTLDWRIGVIYSDYYNTRQAAGGNTPFTTSLATFQTWTAPGTGGSGDERCLESSQDFINDHQADIRANATVVILLLSDEDEQSTGVSQTAQDGFVSFFQTRGISVNGLICRPGYPLTNCFSGAANTYENVITRLGGVLGEIEDLNSIGPTISAVINAAGGATSPYQLSQAPISATLKVAMDDGTGTVIQVPRSRTNGFDYDGANQTLQFFGSYRPAAVGLNMAVSYRYWNDLTTNPDGSASCGVCAPPTVCNPTTNTCDCPANCGGNQPSPNYACDPVSCAWTCPVDCNGTCNGYQTCDQSTCSCVCAPNVTCGAGYKYDTTSCSCVCDPSQFLECTGNFALDPNACACVCQPNCGGNCAANETCNSSTCTCAPNVIP